MLLGALLVVARSMLFASELWKSAAILDSKRGYVGKFMLSVAKRPMLIYRWSWRLSSARRLAGDSSSKSAHWS